ncbi:tRNA (adenosine(37)-N6)-dimethylallyltransferase MiaA [Temperatibacter marinus]|uniref:tRNA dimethylallyltransferase n=1 Tax=Temperatibacter marinus TaxID=1456591 RepID=A0AA52H8F5_9PROT|nr:tRNA (adenosine(37)-N6)-dimethylallyltransferase MiaA [Temperatibacter marinus]WND02076.1 tRNA (adenosine(37)-N6)-dimethylallyltransferase MiaA [Temperatibacter marinus]
MKHTILIAGPTASGKSAFALMLAKKMNGVVINADSMQVYRDLRILTARPSQEEEAEAPHKLYGYLDASDVCSAADWTVDAIKEIRAAQARGQLPIVVGGTGMYFRFLLEGVATIPKIEPAIRESVRQECEQYGSEALHARLREIDPPLFKKLHSADSQRICRALEVWLSSGKALSEWQKKNEPGPLLSEDQEGVVHKYVLSLDRETLYDRCNLRFDLMMEQGTMNEVENLNRRGLDSNLPCMKSLGYPDLIRYLNKEVSLEVAIENSKMQTRRFSKRQLTWFRNQFSQWNFIDTQQLERESDRLIKYIIKK